MSMICMLRRVSDEAIATLLETPDDIRFFLNGPEAPKPPSFFARLFGKKEEPAAQPAWTRPADEELCDLDKAWHALHYLLTGTDWDGEPPQSYLVKDGEYIGDIDVGYGPARALRSAEVRAFQEALAAISRDELAARFNPQEMMSLDIYPTIWDRAAEDDDTLSYLLEYYDVLRQFLDACVAQRAGVIIWLW